MQQGSMILRTLALILAVGMLGACASGDIATTQPKSPTERSLAQAAKPAAYRLTSGDQLRVSVFELEAKTSEHTVDETGTIVVPPLSPMVVANLTTAEAAAALTQAFVTAGLYKDARVAVDVASYGKYYVLGEVGEPGEFAYHPGISLFAALANAGGHTYRASKSRVFIRKAGDALETEYEITSDLAILPGDVIRVPEIQL